jgi:hypothetical protein
MKLLSTGEHNRDGSGFICSSGVFEELADMAAEAANAGWVVERDGFF